MKPTDEQVKECKRIMAINAHAMAIQVRFCPYPNKYKSCGECLKLYSEQCGR